MQSSRYSRLGGEGLAEMYCRQYGDPPAANTYKGKAKFPEDLTKAEKVNKFDHSFEP